MRLSVLTILCLLVLTGCGATQLSREGLVTQYNQSISAEGTRSSVPLPNEPIDFENPPVVVNWWYAGTLKGRHYFVQRSLTWDPTGQAVGRDDWYRVSAEAIDLQPVFKKTRDARMWVPLYEYGLEGLPPPDDLVTRRQLPKPVKRGDVQQSQQPAVQPEIEQAPTENESE